jgi:hypothetical protein
VPVLFPVPLRLSVHLVLLPESGVSSTIHRVDNHQQGPWAVTDVAVGWQA